MQSLALSKCRSGASDYGRDMTQSIPLSYWSPEKSYMTSSRTETQIYTAARFRVKENLIAVPAVYHTPLLFINGVASDTIDLYPFFNIFRKFDTGFELQVTFNFGVHVSSLDVGNHRRNLVLLYLYSTVTVCGGNLCYHETE
jgi:hypothetical protein